LKASVLKEDGLKNIPLLYEALIARSKVLKAIREFFYKESFLEVETPALVPYQSADMNIFSPEVIIRDFEGRRHRLFLHASPENSMKKLLASGFIRIFQITKAFRDSEVTDLHSPEFTILEWYRADSDYNDMMADAQAIVQSAAKALGKTYASYLGKTCDLFSQWDRISLSDAFREYAEEELLFEREDYEDWFFKNLMEKVEPHLGFGAPTFVYDYPKRLGTMAKPKFDNPQLLERVELYICGIEVADGYSELTDPEEQRRRFEEVAVAESKIMDTELLKVLENGMPQSAGMAIGIDRLLMLLLGTPTIHSIIPFNFLDVTEGKEPFSDSQSP
jgi:lysyl-tRNA synthetase class 2